MSSPLSLLLGLSPFIATRLTPIKCLADHLEKLLHKTGRLEPITKTFVTKMSVAVQDAVEHVEHPSWQDVATALMKLDDDVMTLCKNDELGCMEITVEGQRYHVAVVRDETDVSLVWSGTPVEDEWEPLGGDYHPKHTIITDLAVVVMAAGTFFQRGGLEGTVSWVDDDGEVVIP